MTDRGKELEKRIKEPFYRELGKESKLLREEMDKLLMELHKIDYHRGSAPVHIAHTRGRILKLFPEYEPVELEALGDEEIHTIRYPMAQGIIGQHDMCRAISQATIQHNQAKGQLYRMKEE